MSSARGDRRSRELGCVANATEEQVMRAMLMLPIAAMFVSACSAPPAEQSAQQAADAYKPVISLNQIMVNIVDPHSHEIWDAAANPAKAPKTDEEWRNVRHAAVTLAAGGSLTSMSGNG